MPERAVWQKGRGRDARTSLKYVALVLQLGDASERQERRGRADHGRGAILGKKRMPHDFRLLLKAIAIERSAFMKLISIAAERMPHQRQVQLSLGLRLPYVSHLVNEEALPAKRLLRKILRPDAAFGMEIDIAHRRQCSVAGMKRPPFPLEQPNLRIVDRVAEDRLGDFNLAGSEHPICHWADVRRLGKRTKAALARLRDRR